MINIKKNYFRNSTVFFLDIVKILTSKIIAKISKKMRMKMVKRPRI